MKSVYESLTGKKNPKWADKAYNEKQFPSLAERMVKMTPSLIESIKTSPKGQVPARLRKFVKQYD